MKLIYFVGAPGVGKSTLMETLTARCERQSETKPFAHDYLVRETTPVAIELGKRREAFSGTDALSMSVQPKAVEWINRKRHPLVLGEGARLATYGFLTAARNAGYDVSVIYLVAPEEALQARREGRGSKQNPTWMKGASSRAKRIAEQMQLDAAVHLVTTAPPVQEIVPILLKLEPDLKVLTDD